MTCDSGASDRFLHLLLKPFTDGANVEFQARGSDISSSREGVAKEDLGQAIRHDTGVSTLKPDPLRVTSFRQGDGQWIEVAPSYAATPQWAHREYNCGLFSLTLPKAVR
jgi:hypothetical protein